MGLVGAAELGLTLDEYSRTPVARLALLSSGVSGRAEAMEHAMEEARRKNERQK